MTDVSEPMGAATLLDEFALNVESRSSLGLDANSWLIDDLGLESEHRPSGELVTTHWAIDDFSAQVERRAQEEEKLFERVLQGRDRVLMILIDLAWIACVINFFFWWAQPGHQISIGRTIIVVSLMSYRAVLFPAQSVIYMSRARRVNPRIAVPRMRVAMVVTKAPSEPWDVVRKTICAMQWQSYPHPYDVWLCDEDPSEETEAWCADHGVRISTRHGIAEYQRRNWPRRTKCKEGNLAYFYDQYGYRDYDVVSQLDADHVPAFGYLESVIRPFHSSSVGYVAAPSICDANAKDSWTTRGRLYREGALHGPMQAGCNDGFAPICIGSHYTVRTTALRDIGGIGPELAEDFTTSFLMNASGWEGAFALDAEAHGDGPFTFNACLVQEFQWAQSLVVVGLRMYFQNFRKFPWRLRLRFGMTLLYYPMLALTTVAGLLLAPIAVVTGVPWMDVNYLAFLTLWFLISVPLVTATLLQRRRGVLRPVNAKVISWEAWLFAFASWPFVVWGVCSGLKEWVVTTPRSIKVTPKGNRGLELLRVRALLPFVGVCAIALGAVWERASEPATHFYVVLCFLTVLTYVLVMSMIVVLHASESRRATKAPWPDVLSTIRGSFATVFICFAAWSATVAVVLPHLF
jgi:cellulose synthase (UDP-forming)